MNNIHYNKGKGMSGTVALVDGANKSGAKYEDPIESAIIAMNEPKECSINKLRDYLSKFYIFLKRSFL